MTTTLKPKIIPVLRTFVVFFRRCHLYVPKQCMNSTAFLLQKMTNQATARSSLYNKFNRMTCSYCLAISRRLFSDIRNYSSATQTHTPVPDYYKLIECELAAIPHIIRKELSTSCRELRAISHYYFDGKGKSFRPMITLLMAASCNTHLKSSSELLQEQRMVAVIAEMIHTASLLHDDVIDKATLRRGKPSITVVWDQRKSILAGDYVLSVAAGLLARLGNTDVVTILSRVIDDLVRGEFMQLGYEDNENERFAQYLKKTFRKTASLLAHSCQAVGILGGCSREVCNVAYEYGRNIGIAFQLIDDVLDFVSTDKELGKLTASDLSSGLATAPVLFAAQQCGELNEMIMRRFNQGGDVERALSLVSKSEGVNQTRFIAEKYCEAADRELSQLTDSAQRAALLHLTNAILLRSK